MAETEKKDAADAALNAQAAATAAARAAVTAREEAELRERQAERALKEARKSMREEALAMKGDAVPKGTVDLMPELYLSDEVLIARIQSGALDGVLTELHGLAKAHKRLQPDGTFAERQLALQALEQRRKATVKR
jgi:hypothetical protein